jgi:hypothetical protein
LQLAKTKNNAMTKLFFVLLLTFSILNVFGQDNFQATKSKQKSFPTNLNEGNFTKLEKFNGRIVAFDAEIQSIETSRNNTPFYKLSISDNKYLWTVLMFKNETNEIGDKIRVVGYLRSAEPNEAEKKYLDGKFMVMAFGLVDFENSNFLFLSGAVKQKKQWIDGKIPSSK